MYNLQVVAELVALVVTNPTMSYQDETEYDESWAWSENHAYPAFQPPVQQMVTQVSTKIPPAYAGRSSWFSYEEAVEDWIDLTELDPEKNRAQPSKTAWMAKQLFTHHSWREFFCVILQTE